MRKAGAKVNKIVHISKFFLPFFTFSGMKQAAYGSDDEKLLFFNVADSDV